LLSDTRSVWGRRKIDLDEATEEVERPVMGRKKAWGEYELLDLR
jgi:hypothetical protein